MNRQQQKMKLQQKLTPQQLLLQRLLQLPGSQLEQRIKEEIERNPLIEVEQEQERDTATIQESEKGGQEWDNGTDWDDDDYRYREYLENDPNETVRQRDLSDSISFNDYLQEQLLLRDLDERSKFIGMEIIGSVDGSGYLTRDISLIANDLILRSGIDTDEKEVERILKVVQGFDPAGVGARDLRECMLLQLNRRRDTDKATKIAQTIVDKYFEELANRRYESLKSSLRIDDKTLEEALDIIHKLNPKPGWGTEGATRGVASVIPDFKVYRNGESLSFELTEKNRPKIRLNDSYLEMIDRMNETTQLTKQEKEAVQYIKENKERATQFIDSLQQREQTLRITMRAMLESQHDYFVSGLASDLKPLRLKDIAEKTGYDESTISRVVNQKYVETEFGTFLLKELFSNAIDTEQGDVVATKKIQAVLAEMVAQEDKQNPMTDEALTQALNEQGYPLSRRTVSKYREQLNIPIARLRKRL